MAAAVTREITITYGGFSVGGTTDRLIDEIYELEISYPSSVVEFSFVTSAATEAAFATEVAAVESAFRTDLGDLTITQGSETLITYTDAADTGFNARARILKRENMPAQTGRSRKYTVRIEFDLPADLAGFGGRNWQATRIRIVYSPARRRTVIVTGEYRASGGTGALATYQAAISTYVAGILTTIGGTYNTREEEPEYDDQDKILTFRYVSEEIIFNEASGTLNDSAIISAILRVKRARTAPGDTPVGGTVVQRLVRLLATYECWIDRDVTQDLKGKWENTIRAHIIATVRTIFGKSAIAVVAEDPDFDNTDNRISATMEIIGINAGAVLELEMTTDIQEMSGINLVPVWDTALSKYAFPGPAKRIRTTNIKGRIAGVIQINNNLGGIPGGSILGGGGGLFRFGANPPQLFAKVFGVGAPGQGNANKVGNWVLQVTRANAINRKHGLPGNTLDIADVNFSTVEEWADRSTVVFSG